MTQVITHLLFIDPSLPVMTPKLLLVLALASNIAPVLPTFTTKKINTNAFQRHSYGIKVLILQHFITHFIGNTFHSNTFQRDRNDAWKNLGVISWNAGSGDSSNLSAFSKTNLYPLVFCNILAMAMNRVTVANFSPMHAHFPTENGLNPSIFTSKYLPDASKKPSGLNVSFQTPGSAI